MDLPWTWLDLWETGGFPCSFKTRYKYTADTDVQKVIFVNVTQSVVNTFELDTIGAFHCVINRYYGCKNEIN